jgi:hypothetical protein
MHNDLDVKEEQYFRKEKSLIYFQRTDHWKPLI